MRFSYYINQWSFNDHVLILEFHLPIRRNKKILVYVQCIIRIVHTIRAMLYFIVARYRLIKSIFLKF